MDGREPAPDVLWRKHVALLAYLALSPEYTRSRDHLLGLLWPEKDEAKARHSLSEAVRRLRAGLGARRLLTRRGTIALNADGLTVDALDHDAVGGDFLEGLAVPDAPGFETWLSEQRARFRHEAVRMELESGEHALSASDFDGARAAARRALTLDAFVERGVRLEMRAAALVGDATRALTRYREFERYLDREVGERPSKELRELAERIRAGRWRNASLVHTEAEPPLVGRQRAHHEAFACLRGAMDTGTRVLMVAGAPGMGKSRLLAECVNRWRLEGGVVAVANPMGDDRGSAWSTLRQLMRNGLLDAPGVAATDPAALRMLASVVPSLADRFEPAGDLCHADLANALASLLDAISDEAPLSLMIDDAHLADDASLGALRAAFAGIAGRPAAFVVAAMEDAPTYPAELTKLEADVGRRLTGSTVRLAPFDDADVAELVNHLAPWCEGEAQRDRLTRRVMFESGGDPFLAVTLLRGLAEVSSFREDALVWPAPNTTLETPVPFDVPPLVRAVTIGRVEQMGETARQVLIGACIGGRDVDPRIVASITGLSDGDVESGLAELERGRFVSFDGDRYVVEAATIAEVVLSQLLTPGQRQRLEHRYEAARFDPGH